MARAEMPQSVDAYSSFTDKQWNYINDINNGVYANNSGLTQVQFDLSSIYNSGGFTATQDMFLTIPIVMTAVCATSAGAVVSLPSVGGLGAAASLGGCAGYSLLALKSNYQNLIHQIEIAADGKVINDTQPFINVIQGFRMLSQMTTTDLNTWGTSLNYNQAVDNEKSMTLNMVNGVLVPGAGVLNNIPYGAVAGTLSQDMSQASMNSNAVNTCLSNRISRFADTAATAASSAQSFWGSNSTTQLTFMSATQLATEFKPYFTYVGNVMTWYDVGLIPVRYLCDVFDKMGLVRKLSAVMRI